MHRIRMKYADHPPVDTDTADTRGSVQAYADLLSFELDRRIRPDEISYNYLRKQEPLMIAESAAEGESE